jgi:glycosyltransferase involved in cell wall biosynthesis
MTENNPSTMEKNHLMLNGLEKSGIKTYALGFCHDKSSRDYFEKTYSAEALYSYEYGSEDTLNQGSNIPLKLHNNFKVMIRYFIKLYRHCRQHTYSAIIIPPQPFELTFPTIIIGKLLRVKIVPNLMEYYPSLPNFYDKKSLLKRLSWKIISKYADAYIVISKFLKEKFTASNKKIFILPAILSEANHDPHSNNNLTNEEIVTDSKETHPKLIYTSSLAYNDLLQFCLEALSKIKDRKFTLTITGNYPISVKEKWLETAKNYGLDGKIVFCGFLSTTDLHRLQQNSTALLIPLLNNERHCARFPQKVLGYMAMGKPVITTHIGEIAEYFIDEETAIMDKTVTPDGFSKKIASILENPKLAYKIGQKGSTFVKETFSEEYWGIKLNIFLNRI